MHSICVLPILSTTESQSVTKILQWSISISTHSAGCGGRLSPPPGPTRRRRATTCSSWSSSRLASSFPFSVAEADLARSSARFPFLPPLPPSLLPVACLAHGRIVGSDLTVPPPPPRSLRGTVQLCPPAAVHCRCFTTNRRSAERRRLSCRAQMQKPPSPRPHRCLQSSLFSLHSWDGGSLVGLPSKSSLPLSLLPSSPLQRPKL